VHITCHPHCSLGTYLAIEPDTKRPVPITRFIDVEGFFLELDAQADKIFNARFKRLSQATALYQLQRYFKRSEAPSGLDFAGFMHSLDGMTDHKIGRDPVEKTYKLLLVAGMHFMDGYNYELERVRRCVIHYATPAGRIIPFCAYNCGLVHRTTIEDQFSVPMEEYLKRRKENPRAGD